METETDLSIAIAFGVVFGAMLWGFHASIFVWFINICRRKHVKRSLRVSCTAGIVLSTATLAVYMFHMYNTFSIGYGVYYGLHSSNAPVLVVRVRTAFRWLYFASMTISDSVQIWRTLWIWGRSKTVYFTLLPLFLVSTVCGLIFCITTSYIGGNKSLPHNLELTSSVTDVLNIAASLALNVCATGLMAYKIKAHTRVAREIYGAKHRSLARFDFLAAVLIDSGIIYTISQAWYFMCHNIAFNYAWDPTKHTIGQMGCVVQILSCMYPVSVVVFAEAAKRVAEEYSAFGGDFTDASIGSSTRLPTSTSVTKGVSNHTASSTGPSSSGSGLSGKRPRREKFWTSPRAPAQSLPIQFQIDTVTHVDADDPSSVFTTERQETRDCLDVEYELQPVKKRDVGEGPGSAATHPSTIGNPLPVVPLANTKRVS